MSKFGFFLILLSVLIAIGAIVYVVKPYNIFTGKLDEVRVSDLENVSQALEAYYRDYGKYPNFNEEYEIVTGDETHPWGGVWKPYMDRLPKDPGISKRYVYWADSRNGYQSYKLYASLELPELIPTACGGKECPGVPRENMCGDRKSCNFGITSSNISP